MEPAAGSSLPVVMHRPRGQSRCEAVEASLSVFWRPGVERPAIHQRCGRASPVSSVTSVSEPRAGVRRPFAVPMLTMEHAMSSVYLAPGTSGFRLRAAVPSWDGIALGTGVLVAGCGGASGSGSGPRVPDSVALSLAAHASFHVILPNFSSGWTWISAGYPSRSRGTVGLLFNSPSGAQVYVTEYPTGRGRPMPGPRQESSSSRANRGTSTERFSSSPRFQVGSVSRYSSGRGPVSPVCAPLPPPSRPPSRPQWPT